eukprot:6401581-Prymnesium_polylepis.1
MYSFQGIVANGSPYYRLENSGGNLEYSLYYDLNCGGSSSNFGRWVLDNELPDPTRSFDLDNDGRCVYGARRNTPDGVPPLGTQTWRVSCGGWRDLDVTIVAIILPPTAPPVPPAVP